MTLSVHQALVDEWLQWTAGRKAENTRLGYARDLVSFLKWLYGGQARWTSQILLAVTPLQVFGFVDTLLRADNPRRPGNVVDLRERRGGYAASTINRRVAALAGFYRYMLLTGRLDKNPVVTVPVPGRRAGVAAARKVARTDSARVAETHTLPQVLDQGEIDRFLATLRTWRDRALFTLLLVSGLRISEALHLKRDDVDFATCAVRVRPSEGWQPKNHSVGLVAVSPGWLRTVNRYLIEEHPGSSGGWLFVVLKGPRRGNRLSYSGVNEIFRYHRERAGTPRVRPHRARHTFATLAVQAGVRREVLKRQLRHSSTASLDPYVHASDLEVIRDLAAVQDRLYRPDGGDR